MFGVYGIGCALGLLIERFSFDHTGDLMKRLALLIISLLIAGCATNSASNAQDQVTNEILVATDAWRAAYDSRDAARINAMYGSGAVFWGTTMKSIATSPEGIAEYFKDAATRPNARVMFTQQNVRVYGDVAFNSGAYTFKDTRDGKDIANPSRYSMIFHREGKSWILVHHHSSRLP
jgi:hypothetical protein